MSSDIYWLNLTKLSTYIICRVTAILYINRLPVSISLHAQRSILKVSISVLAVMEHSNIFQSWIAARVFFAIVQIVSIIIRLRGGLYYYQV